MDNNPTPSQPQVQTQPGPTLQDQTQVQKIEEPTFHKKSKSEMLKQLTNLEFLNLTPRNKKFLKIALAVLTVTVALLIITSIFNIGTKRGGGQSQPVPTATPDQNAPVRNPSPYADDPEVAEIEMQIEALDTKLSDTQITESDIQPPQLDWNITF